MALKAAGNPGLTRREREIAALVADGLTNREIAQRLFISERTADGHLEHIREKLGVSSRAQIAAWFVEQGRPHSPLGAGQAPPPIAPASSAAEAVGVPATPRVQRPRTATLFAGLVGVLLVGVAGLIYFNVRQAAAPTGPLVTTFAGHSRPGYFQGGYSGDFDLAVAAQLSHPIALATTPDGVYIADAGNHCIRRVDGNGVITTIAGGGSDTFAEGANASSVKLPFPVEGLAVAPDGRIFFSSGSLVYHRDPDLTIHLVHFPASSPPLQDAYALAFDPKGNLYIADHGSNMVLRLAPDGSLTTYAGTGEAKFGADGGAATGASLNQPAALAFDSAGNLYIADLGNNRIRRVDAVTGIITTVAGSDDIYGFKGDGGLATRARLSLPAGIAVDNGWLYLADTGNDRIRRVSLASGLITTLAGAQKTGFSGDGGPASQAEFFGPLGLAFDSHGNLLVADAGNNRIREIHLLPTTR